MADRSEQLDRRIEHELLIFCRHIAGADRITAICVCGNPDLKRPKPVIEVILVVCGFQQKLMTYLKAFGKSNIIVYAVDEWVFERDVDRAFLGEALASRLIFPYVPLANPGYLRSNEVKLKKRLILELLENTIFSFPELCYDLCIMPQYFLYESMLLRARVFPPSVYLVLDFMRKDSRKENERNSLQGYFKAINELEEECVVSYVDNCVRISRRFIDKTKNRKARFVSFMRDRQKTIMTYLLSVFPETLNMLSQNRESLLKLQRSRGRDSRDATQIEDPQKYLLVPTSSGLVPLSNKMDIAAFAKTVLGTDEDSHVEIKEMGGILNNVYLVETTAGGERKRAVAKRFRDWSNFKWFPLALWTIGTRTFAVLGQSRLERECAINQFLSSKGFAVPQILSVSPNERLVFMRYVEGDDLSKTVRNIALSKSKKELRKNLTVINRVGRVFAKVHALSVALGDTKPENILLGKNGEIVLTDFEQASRNGDKVWDIAEFLYYAGHYIPPFVDAGRAELLAKAFIDGYIERGGDPKLVEKAATPKYTKVFSLFALPLIMLAIAGVCRRARQLKV